MMSMSYGENDPDDDPKNLHSCSEPEPDDFTGRWEDNGEDFW